MLCKWAIGVLREMSNITYQGLTGLEQLVRNQANRSVLPGLIPQTRGGAQRALPQPFIPRFNRVGGVPAISNFPFANFSPALAGLGMPTPWANAANQGFNAMFQQPAANMPFVNPQGFGLDPMQLATGLMQSGMNPLAALIGGMALSRLMNPQQFMQPMWNAMGNQGQPNLGQMAGQWGGPAGGAAGHGQQAGGVAGNGQQAGGVGAPAGNVGPQNPVNAGQIQQNGENTQQRILERGNAVAQDLFGRGSALIDNARGGVQGRIDRSDLVRTANGQVRALTDKEFREVQIRTHTVEGAKILDQAKKAGRGMGFANDLRKTQANPNFWNVDQAGKMSVRQGVNPAEAVDDVFANPNAYNVDCATAAHLVGLRAIKNTIGPEDFNRSHRGLNIYGWKAQRLGEGGNMQSISKVTGNQNQRGQGGLRAGDVGYFKNPDNISEEWQGENVISLGGDKYWGHPGGSKSSQQWVDWINKNARTPYATRDAFLSSLTGDWGASRWAAHDYNPTTVV
jgi:protein-glutamine gamma-glutamyltransferase